MKIEELQKNWEAFGETDPLWSILTHADKKDNQWNEDEFFLTGKRSINHLVRSLQKQLNIPFSNRRVLDFGCGVGRCTFALADHFEQVVGIDIAQSMIELADGYNTKKEQISFYQSADPALALFEDQSFSFIYSSITLQHINPKFSKKYLESFIRILEPEGLLFFQLPSAPPKSLMGKLLAVLPEGVLNQYRKIKYGKQAVMEMHWIPSKEIHRLMDQFGAKVVHERTQVLNDGFTSNWYYIRKLG